MNDKLDKITDTLAEIKVDIAEIRIDLNYHIKATRILEAQQKPLVKAHQNVRFALRATTWLAGTGGLIAGLLRFLGHL